MRTPDGWWVTPVTVKAVLVQDGAVLLCRTSRGDWELPGGRPDEGEASVRETVVREVREETGLAIRVGGVLHAELFEPVPGTRLMLVALAAELDGDPFEPTPSAEHDDVRWFPLDALPDRLPAPYAEAIRRSTT